jgi:hypothetical protein
MAEELLLEEDVLLLEELELELDDFELELEATMLPRISLRSL